MTKKNLINQIITIAIKKDANTVNLKMTKHVNLINKYTIKNKNIQRLKHFSTYNQQWNKQLRT